MVAARRSDDAAAPSLLRWLRSVAHTAIEPDKLEPDKLIEQCGDARVLDVIAAGPHALDDDAEADVTTVDLPTLAAEMRTYLAFVATLLEYFDNDLDLRWMEADDPVAPGPTSEDFALARRDFATGWPLAWDAVTDIRKGLKLDPIAAVTEERESVASPAGGNGAT